MTPASTALNVPAELGGGGVGLLGWSLAAEELAQGCASTALAFNMHLSVVGPMMESSIVPPATKERLAKMVVAEGKLIGGNFSEPTTSGLVATPVPLTRARRVDGGYRVTGRKAFASMIAVADYVMVLARPDEAAPPTAAMFLLVPPDAPGRRVDHVWDTLGMRATRSDSMTLDECFVSDDALLVATDDVVPFRRDGANWFWASYTPVYLGIGVAAYRAISEIVKGRTPPGFTQSLAYHPDVRRQVGEMSVDLEAARLLTHHAAWLSDTQGPTPATLSALYRAKYFVGEAVTRVTRTAMTLGGAHALFKTSPLERFFRDGAVAPGAVPAARLLSLHARHVRAGPRPARRAAAAEERSFRLRPGRALDTGQDLRCPLRSRVCSRPRAARPTLEHGVTLVGYRPRRCAVGLIAYVSESRLLTDSACAQSQRDEALAEAASVGARRDLKRRSPTRSQKCASVVSSRRGEPTGRAPKSRCRFPSTKGDSRWMFSRPTLQSPRSSALATRSPSSRPTSMRPPHACSI